MQTRRQRDFISAWIAVVAAVSIVSWLEPGIGSWFALSPERVWHGQVWRLVTWAIVAGSPMGLVLSCAGIYKFGGELIVRWGPRRLRRFVLELVVAVAVATCLIAAVAGAGWMERFGSWAVSEALVIAWARQFPFARLQLYGMIVVSGQRLVVVTCAVALLYALYGGVVAGAPELLACGFAALYPDGWLRR
jgi:membrane associated rhomboid family serine protease|nr:hypothetical protein [Kofleriaceae bacterium]